MNKMKRYATCEDCSWVGNADMHDVCPKCEGELLIIVKDDSDKDGVDSEI